MTTLFLFLLYAAVADAFAPSSLQQRLPSVPRCASRLCTADSPAEEPLAETYDGSLDAIYKAGDAARLAPRRGDAEGEDFDFGCPSAPDDFFTRMSFGAKPDSKRKESTSRSEAADKRAAPKSLEQRAKDHPNML